MSPAPNYRNDTSIFDGRQSVTIALPETHEPFTAFGLKRPVTTREMEVSGGLYMPGDVRWHFVAASLDAAPIVGTLITESGGRVWSVVDTQATVFGGQLSCISRLVAS